MQSNLLDYSKGDPSIKNPSRVMRLAGFNHQETGQTSKIISTTDTRHDPGLLAKIIAPPVQPQRLSQPQSPIKPPQIDRLGEILSIPLVKCLAKTSRELLNGVGAGSRNSSGAKLARDLIGTANYLERERIDYDGDARSLFDDFARACTPPLPASEQEKIWRSAQQDNPTPSCPPDAIDNILASWGQTGKKVITLKSYQQISTQSQNGSEQGLNDADRQSAPYQHLSALSAEEIKTAVEQIFSKQLTAVDREVEIVALAAKFKLPKQSLENIYKQLELAANASADNSDIDKILSAQHRSLSPHRVLPAALAHKIEQIATARGSNSEPLTLGLLVACSSVAHANTRLSIGNYGDILSVYPNLFGMVVAESGSLKSPTIGTAFTKPLRALQDSYIERYESQLEQYRQDKRAWDERKNQDKERNVDGVEPVEPRLTVTLAGDVTIEKLEELAFYQPKICPALYRDELVGIFQAFEKHGGKGGGDAVSKLLSYYDGARIDTHRMGAGSRISKHDFHPAVFGGIQPEVLQGLARRIGMDDSGTLCRFLYAPLERTFKEWDTNPDTPKIDIDTFHQLIQKVHELPALQCTLDSSAQSTWAKIVNRYNRQCLNDPRLSPWLKHSYSKAIGQLAKLTLTLHLIECASVDRVSSIISTVTIERAAMALDYFIAQAIALIATTEETLESHLVRVLAKAKKLGIIAPRQVQTLFSGKKRIDSNRARSYLQHLVDGGYGKLDDKGWFIPSDVKVAPSHSADNADNADKMLISYQQPEPAIDKVLDRNADNADKNQPSIKGENIPKKVSGSKVGGKNGTKKLNFRVGDRVCFAGKNPSYAKQYAGDLEIYDIEGNTFTCKKPDGSLTSWIELEDLRLVS